MTRPRYLSITQLKMYLRCPLQYFFRYVCGIKTPPTGGLTLGRTVHETLKQNYRRKMKTHSDLPLPDVTDIFSHHWEREVKETVFSDGENPGKLKDQGVQLLGAYYQKIAPKVQPIEVEKEFLIDTGRTQLPLKGYIDLIDDERRIIDHKTSKRSLQKEVVDRDIQLSAYAMAYRALYGKEEKAVRLDVMIRNKSPRIQQLQ